jgi:poly(3-hydroxybutyrate) depolymerase
MRRRGAVVAAAAAVVLGACGGGDEASEPVAPTVEGAPRVADGGGKGTPPATGDEKAAAFRRVPGATTGSAQGPFGDEGLDRWRDEVPDVEDIGIRSSSDGERQGALWLPPAAGAGKGRPLLVVLHSWGNRYPQHVGIPFAKWAQREGWAMIAPNFRGVDDEPQATGSIRAVSDVIDAVDYAVEQGGVDRDRVYAIGFSGGGMMSLLMAGRHPDRFAGVAAWVPVHDLVRWHGYNASLSPPPDYAAEIEASCGGNPQAEAGARRRCLRRSPISHLDRARKAGIPVYLGHGTEDTLVPPDHALRAFNQLADPADRVGRRTLARVARNDIPDHLRGDVENGTGFDRRDPDVVFARRSADVTLALFEGEHDLVYHPALRWMSRLAAR